MATCEISTPGTGRSATSTCVAIMVAGTGKPPSPMLGWVLELDEVGVIRRLRPPAAVACGLGCRRPRKGRDRTRPLSWRPCCASALESADTLGLRPNFKVERIVQPGWSTARGPGRRGAVGLINSAAAGLISNGRLDNVDRIPL